MPPTIVVVVDGAAPGSAPREVFPAWRRVEVEVDRLAWEPPRGRVAEGSSQRRLIDRTAA